MQELVLRKAERQKAKIRIGLSAVSGGGKTYSAILMAKGLTGGSLENVAIIDTENGSADLYSHMGDFKVITMYAPFSPERYINAIQMCESAGMEVIIIDSIAHEWEGEGGILSMADTMGGGFQTAWKALTPRHDRFKNAILASKCHVITTVRRKQEYILVEEMNKQGRHVQKPVKAGMKESTREGWEYELTVNLQLEPNHLATASKDRTGLFMDKEPMVITEETGRLLKQWCENGIDLQGEIYVAINRLSGCNTPEELKLLKATLNPQVITAPEFKDAAWKRFNEIKPAAPADPIPPAAPEAPTVQATYVPAPAAPAQTPYNKSYTDGNTLMAVITAAGTPTDLETLLQHNRQFIEGNPNSLLNAWKNKKHQLESAGKVIITDSQLKQVCEKIMCGDKAMYQTATGAYALTPLQKAELERCMNELAKLENAIAAKHDNPATVANIIMACNCKTQLDRLAANSAELINRDPQLKNMIGSKYLAVKAA